MRWWKNWSRSISGRSLVGTGLAVLAVALLLSPLALRAQESLEQRYQRAVDLFNNAKMEDACDLFQEIEKEKAGYKQTGMYRNAACTEAKKAYDFEEKLFTEGVQAFNQGRYDDAKQKFEQASRIPLRKPKYRDQINRYLRDIETRVGEDALFQEGVKLFNEGNDTEARARFNQVVRGGGAKAAEARSYLQRIETRREESAFNEGVSAFKSGDFATARSRLQEVVALNGKYRGEAQRYLDQIDQAEREQRAYNEAVRAFQDGRFSEAQNGFQQVVGMNGPHKNEAQRYLGQIEAAAKELAAFNDAVSKYEQKDYEGARAAFQQVIDLRGAHASEARSYLARIETRGQDPKQAARQFVADARTAIGRKDYQAAVEKLKAAEALDPSNRDARQLLGQVEELAAEQPLRGGLQAYFEGNYEEAERQLTTYLNNNGRKRALAYFFRGAVHGSRFFLSGEQDAQQKQQALADFRALQPDARRFRLPEKYVPPKILALYREAVGTQTR